MSMDHTGSRGDDALGSGSTNSVTDAPLMAATPIWETRGKKRRGLGRGGASGATAATTGSAATEPRSFASDMGSPHERAISETRPMTGMTSHEPSMASAATVTDPMTGRPDMTDDSMREGGDAAMMTPIGRGRSRSAPARKSGVPAAAIAAGVVALGAVGAAGWYASRSDDGVAELTPGAAQESMAIAQAPTSPAAPLASATGPAATNGAGASAGGTAAAPTTTTSTTATARTERSDTVRTASAPRTRPAVAATAPSAADAGINASGTATLPTGPQPYSALNPGAGTDTATTGATGSSGIANTPSATPSVTPAPMPSTPPIASDPSPTTATPATPDAGAVTPPSTTVPQ